MEHEHVAHHMVAMTAGGSWLWPNGICSSGEDCLASPSTMSAAPE